MAGKQKLLSVKEILARDDNLFHGNYISTSCTQRSDMSGASDVEKDTADVRVALAVDFMGGLDCRAVPVVIDDDEFHDPDGKLLEESDDEEFDDALDDEVFGQGHAVNDISSFSVDEDDDQEAVMLEESPLPRMFVPGKIVHIYSQRGVYKAVYVPRDFRELRRVSLAGNMLSDHKCKSYYEALLEVRSVRRAKEAAPRWTAFDEDDTWYVLQLFMIYFDEKSLHITFIVRVVLVDSRGQVLSITKLKKLEISIIVAAVVH